MSIYAAIGYVVGIMIFALLMRRYRHKMISKHIEKAKTNLSQCVEENQND